MNGSLVPAGAGSSSAAQAPATAGLAPADAQANSDAISAADRLGRAVFESLPNHIAVLDKDGTILRVNRAWRRFAEEHGVPEAVNAFVGASYLDVCRAAALHGVEAAHAVLAGLEAVLAGEQTTFVCDYVHDVRREPRWFELRAERLAEPDDGVVVSHLDISARKRAELDAANRLHELAHVSRAVTMGVLAGSAAHELSQPLTAILSNAQAALRFLASDPPQPEMVRDILQDIASADQRASEIIRRIRRLLNKGEPVERVDVDLNDIVQEALRMLADEALLRKVRTTVLREPGLPSVAADPVQLQQVLLNLALNAFEAMDEVPPSERTLVVRTARRAAGQVEVVVLDRGPAVDDLKLLRMFEPFFTTKKTGMGMGLYITRAIIESHGGWISAARAGERGLRITVLLPPSGRV